MTQKVTSVEVAQLAGVSQPTVSRAFDPNASVHPATRAKILAAANELGYQPNIIARSLSTRRTNIVGLVMGNLTNSLFFPQVVDLLSERLQAFGKQSLLFRVAPDQPVDDILPYLLGYQVDALVIASTTPSPHIIEECQQKNTPVILFNRFAPETSANSVCCDNVAGSQMVADLFLDSGHKRIAFLAGIANTSTNAMRTEGFVGRLKERGYTDVIREQGSYSYESGYELASRLFAQDNPPDAIFCAADIMAMGAIDAAREKGLAIPDDVAIVGFDDISVAGWPAYNLTTIQQPIEQMVETAVSLIATSEPPSGQSHLLPGKLILRGTTRNSKDH